MDEHDTGINGGQCDHESERPILHEVIDDPALQLKGNELDQKYRSVSRTSTP